LPGTDVHGLITVHGLTTQWLGSACGPKAVRNRSRKASIRHTGACGAGRRPSVQPQPEIRSRTAGSCATIVTGTSRLAASPVMIGAGWWSPRNTSTRLSSPLVLTHEIKLSTEYAME